jgi:MYXO-CTERM domain-containing protein
VKYLIALIVVAAAVPRNAAAATYDWELSPSEQFRMWIDDDQAVIYGFYVIWNESAGDTRVLAEREIIQQWARTFGFGIIGTQLPDPGYADTLVQAMEEFAGMSGHPEIADAPVICEGLSLGGYSSMEFAGAHPERTIAFLSGASGRVDAPRAAGFNSVPGLFYLGDEDPDLENAVERTSEVMAIRADGAQVAYFIQWGAGHERGFADELGWKFLADAVRLRYPEGASPADGPVQLIDIPDDFGWLADQGTWESALTEVFPFADAPGSAEDYFWLPTRDAAFAYRGHATSEQPIAFTDPNDMVDWTVVDPGDDVDIAVSVAGLGDVTSVEILDGSASIAVLDTAPYRTTWTAEGIGAHALVAVATLGDGSIRSGYIAPVLVLGSEAPGGGELDDGNRPDAGPGAGGDGDGGPTAGGGDGDGGCGCRANDPGAPLSALLVLIALAGATRRGRKQLG